MQCEHAWALGSDSVHEVVKLPFLLRTEDIAVSYTHLTLPTKA